MEKFAATIPLSLRGILNRFGLELAVVESGKDNGLLPINSFAIELFDLCATPELPEALRLAAAAVRRWIDRILDTTAVFDDTTIEQLSRWHGWMATAIT